MDKFKCELEPLDRWRLEQVIMSKPLQRMLGLFGDLRRVRIMKHLEHESASSALQKKLKLHKKGKRLDTPAIGQRRPTGAINRQIQRNRGASESEDEHIFHNIEQKQRLARAIKSAISKERPLERHDNDVEYPIEPSDPHPDDMRDQKVIENELRAMAAAEQEALQMRRSKKN